MTLRMRDVFSQTPKSIWSKTDADIMMIKMTQGTGYVNPIGDTQYQTTKKNGKMLGFYHYASGGDPAKEADYFYRNCKNYFGEGVPCLDWESNQNAAWGNKNWALTFAKRLHDLSGVWPLIYVQASAIAQVASCAPYCGLWVAGYPFAKVTWSAPAMPYKIAPWKAATAWQYTSGTSAAPQDLNIVYVDKAAWQRIANPTGGKATTKAKPATTAKAKPYSVAGKTLYALATDTIAGKLGSGTARKAKLGKLYTGVQALVNYQSKACTNAEAIKVLVAETKAGAYGSGAARKALLGAYYDDVQSAINGNAKVARTYTVKAGDTLSAIGTKLGVKWTKLASKNGLKAPYVIYAGQKLKY